MLFLHYFSNAAVSVLASSKTAPLVCVSSSLSPSADISSCLQYLVCLQGKLQKRQNKTNTHNRAYSIQHSHIAEMSSSTVVPPGSNCLFWSVDVVPRWYRPIVASSRAAIHAAVTVSGFPAKSPWMGVVSTPICSLRCCPLLLPNHRHFEMASGDLWCFVVHPDLGLRNKISPLICARGAVCNHIFLFLQGSWSLQWVVLPVPMSPIVSSGCTVGEVMGAWRAGRW